MSAHLREAWGALVRTAAGTTYYRLHKQSRPWSLEPTSQEFSTNLYDPNVKKLVGPARKGYSCFENPWHLWHYVLIRRWYYADVAAFTGRRSSQRGVDDEPLVTPTAPPIRWFGWAEFQDWLRTQPMGDPPSYKGAYVKPGVWGDAEETMRHILKAYDPDEFARLFEGAPAKPYATHFVDPYE